MHWDIGLQGVGALSARESIARDDRGHRLHLIDLDADPSE